MSVQPSSGQLTGTDTDWSAGDGLDVVTGPIEALVLTLAGRFAALDQLHGDGAVTPRACRRDQRAMTVRMPVITGALIVAAARQG